MQSSWARPRGRRASRRETGWGHQCKMVTQRIGDEKKPLKEGFRKFGECHVRLSVADINRGDFFAARSPAPKRPRFREFGSFRAESRRVRLAVVQLYDKPGGRRYVTGKLSGSCAFTMPSHALRLSITQLRLAVLPQFSTCTTCLTRR